MRVVTVLLALATAASLGAPALAQSQSSQPVLVPPPAAVASMPKPTVLSASQRATITRELKSKWQAAANARPGGGVRWARLLTQAIATAEPDYVLRATTATSLDDLHKALAGGDIRPKASAGSDATDGLGNGVASEGILGSSVDADLVYTPLPNGRCRVFDTRGLSGPLVGTRNIEIEAMSTYSGQGGSGTFANGTGSTNCGIPLYAGAYAVSVVLTAPTASGPVKVFEFGKPQQTGNTVIMNAGSYGSGGNLIVNSCVGCAYEIGVNSATSVHVAVDVIGYYLYATLPPTRLPACYETANASTALAANDYGELTPPACYSGYTRMTTICWMGHYTANLSGVLGGRCYGSSSFASSINGRNVCCLLAGR